MMGGLAGAFAFDLARSTQKGTVTTKQMLIIVLSVMAFSIADEWAQQTFTDTRSSELGDLAADWLGCWVAYFTAPQAVKATLKKFRDKE